MNTGYNLNYVRLLSSFKQKSLKIDRTTILKEILLLVNIGGEGLEMVEEGEASDGKKCRVLELVD